MIRARLRTVSLPTWFVTFAFLMYVTYVSRVQLSIHRGFGTSAYDIGLFDQGIWLMSRFKTPFVTLMGRNLMGDHAQPILLLVVPIYWIYSSINVLIVLQTICIGAGMVPLYWYARRLLGNEWMALVLSLCWLFNPAVVWTNFENYHPDSFLAVFIPLALFAALERRWRLYVVACALAVLVKEDVVLVLAPLGIFVALARHRRIGVATVLASVGATLAGMYLLMRGLIGMPTRNGWRIPFGGVGGTIRTALTEPGVMYRYLTSQGRLFYLWQLTAPFAGLFLLAPDIAAVSSVVVLSNIVSTFWYQFHINYHYTLVVVPALAFATVAAIARRSSPDVRRWMVGVVVVFTVGSCVAWGPYAFSNQPVAYGYHDSAVATDGRAIMRGLPDDVSVSVFHSFAPHLAHRDSIYFWPNPFVANYYGTDYSRTDGTRLPTADSVQYVILPVVKPNDMESIWSRESAAFALIRANGSWELWERQTSGQPRP